MRRKKKMKSKSWTRKKGMFNLLNFSSCKLISTGMKLKLKETKSWDEKEQDFLVAKVNEREEGERMKPFHSGCQHTFTFGFVIQFYPSLSSDFSLVTLSDSGIENESENQIHSDRKEEWEKELEERKRKEEKGGREEERKRVEEERKWREKILEF